MLSIVIKKPIQVTIVSDDPRFCGETFCATSAENNGESATTAIPQRMRNTMKAVGELFDKKTGESRQHAPDIINEAVAIFFAPKCFESKPLHTHATAPEAMTIKDNRGIFKTK